VDRFFIYHKELLMKKLMIAGLMAALSTAAFAGDDDCHYLHEYHAWEGVTATQIGHCTYKNTLVHNFPNYGYLYIDLTGSTNPACPSELRDKVYIKDRTCHPEGDMDYFTGLKNEEGSMYKNDDSMSIKNITLPISTAKYTFDIISAKMDG